MKIWKIASAATVLVLSTSANAALIGHDLDGDLATAEAYYDTESDLTWLADANYARTTDYIEANSLGRMVWSEASTWVTGLDINGVSGWRLPETIQPDANCSQQFNESSWGYGCSGSEMGNLFYNVLGNSAGSITNTGPFSNIGGAYWSATNENAEAWYFSMQSGQQDYYPKSWEFYTWAVHDGEIGVQISAVPVPAAVWLFGSGLIGLIGVARRKKA